MERWYVGKIVRVATVQYTDKHNGVYAATTGIELHWGFAGKGIFVADERMGMLVSQFPMSSKVKIKARDSGGVDRESKIKIYEIIEIEHA